MTALSVTFRYTGMLVLFLPMTLMLRPEVALSETRSGWVDQVTD